MTGTDGVSKKEGGEADESWLQVEIEEDEEEGTTPNSSGGRGDTQLQKRDSPNIIKEKK